MLHSPFITAALWCHLSTFLTNPHKFREGYGHMQSPYEIWIIQFLGDLPKKIEMQIHHSNIHPNRKPDELDLFTYVQQGNELTYEYIHMNTYTYTWLVDLHRPAVQLQGVLEPFFRRKALGASRLRGGFGSSKDVGKPFAPARKQAVCGFWQEISFRRGRGRNMGGIVVMRNEEHGSCGSHWTMYNLWKGCDVMVEERRKYWWSIYRERGLRLWSRNHCRRSSPKLESVGNAHNTQPIVNFPAWENLGAGSWLLV